jgi:hypothetical protein
MGGLAFAMFHLDHLSCSVLKVIVSAETVISNLVKSNC